MTEGESQSGPRFCRQCGGVVPVGTAICPKCGQKWYLDRTEQQGVDLWQKIIERRAAAGLAEDGAAQDPKQYRCPNCMAILKGPAPICPHCGKSTIKAKIVPSDNEPERASGEEGAKLDFTDAAKGLGTIKGAGQRAIKLQGRKRLRRLDAIIIAVIIVIVAGIGFFLALQMGVIPAKLLSFSKPAASQPPSQAATTAPVISNISVSNVTGSAATIAWSTDKPAWGKILYGKSDAYGAGMLAALQSNSQTLTITGLDPAAAYHFAVLATDGKGMELSRSSDGVFSTLQPTDTKMPVVSQVKVIATDVSAIIQWTTDEPATSQVLYGPDASVANSSQLDSNLITNHSVRITGLESNATYYYRIKSVDAAGNATVMDPPNTLTTLITVPIGSKIGERASDFTLPIFKSQDSVVLRNYRGQKVLLTFWAVYCPECDRELALLQTLKDKNIPGVNIIAVFLESKPEDIEKTIAKFTTDHGKLTVPVVVDMYKTTAHLYNVEKLPCTFFIDGDMIIRDVEFGSFNIDQVEQTLRGL
jgi:peroxiredoxin/RNA polymerase subunit RPABC4/transcription elongation factor Spt4